MFCIRIGENCGWVLALHLTPDFYNFNNCDFSEDMGNNSCFDILINRSNKNTYL